MSAVVAELDGSTSRELNNYCAKKKINRSRKEFLPHSASPRVSLFANTNEIPRINFECFDGFTELYGGFCRRLPENLHICKKSMPSRQRFMV